MNFSGVIAFDFSIGVAANTVFWESRNKKIYRDLVSCSNENKYQIKTHSLEKYSEKYKGFF